MSLDDRNDLLIIPQKQQMHYKRNLIQLVTCELRIPTLLELESQQPVLLQKALRKEYPLYDRGININIGPDRTSEAVYKFSTATKEWSVALRASSLVLETTKYSSFESFMERLRSVVKAAQPYIDTDFFTRVGLRYVNALPVKPDALAGWLNPELGTALAQGSFGRRVAGCWQEIVGMSNMGTFIFKHGLAGPSNTGEPGYAIDIDFFTDTVLISDLEDCLPNLNGGCHHLFNWSLGEKAKQHLSL